jgi:stage V sporulation protein G
MEISEVRVRLIDDPNARLKAFCSITLDEVFVIRDLKIVDGVNGPFVAMPSRRIMNPCRKCGQKNHLRARYCNDCGAKLSMAPVPKDADGNPKLHRDVAHPISADFREVIQRRVLEAYLAEAEATVVERVPAIEDQEEEEEQATKRPQPEKEAVSEYDSLIAGLGTGREERETHGDRRHQRAARKGAATKSRSGASHGDAEDRPRRGGRRRSEQASRKPSTQAVNEVPAAEKAAVEAASEPDSSPEPTAPAFGIGVLGAVSDEDVSKERDTRAPSDQAGSAAAASSGSKQRKAAVVARAEKPVEQRKPNGDRTSVDPAEEESGPDEGTQDDTAAFGAGLV